MDTDDGFVEGRFHAGRIEVKNSDGVDPSLQIAGTFISGLPCGRGGATMPGIGSIKENRHA